MQLRTRTLRTALLAAVLVASVSVLVSVPAAAAETVGYSVWAPGSTTTVQGRVFGRLDRESAGGDWNHQSWCVDRGAGYTSVNWVLHRPGLAPSTIGGATCNDQTVLDISSASGPFERLTVTVCKIYGYGLLLRRCATQEYAVPNP